MNIEDLTKQVKANCNISDARYWGYYSICGLLMRLRELYRSEGSLMPWDEIPKEDISGWIAAKEAQWKALENEDLRPLKIDDAVYDPFQIDEINSRLADVGLLYGAGYGRFNKPVFFLAGLAARKEIYDYRIYYAGKELCRDLSASAAMLQGGCIFIRLDSLKTLLWDKFEELRARKFGGFLKEAFSSYGIEKTEVLSEELFGKIGALSSNLSEFFLRHEMGEAFEDEHSEEWLEILNRNTDRGLEFYLRGIKDILADTSEIGPLKAIIDKKERRLLAFYMVFLDGLRKELFPEIMNTFQRFVEVGGDWSLIEKARLAGYGRARNLREHVLKLWEDQKSADIVSFIKGYLRESTPAAP